MDYTNYDSIRGCLGLDSDDCPDEIIRDSNLWLELEVDLGSWLPTHATIYADGIAEAATADEEKLKNYLVLYSQWYCAHELVSRFLLHAQIVTDGKAQINRFSNMKLPEAKTMAAGRMARYRTLLDEEVNGVSSPVSTPIVFAISQPDYDPVTGA